MRVARPVAVAETAGAADDTIAIVRVRQNGENSLSLTFYRVDDLAGTIDGLRAGQAGYAAAAAGPRLSAHAAAARRSAARATATSARPA